MAEKKDSRTKKLSPCGKVGPMAYLLAAGEAVKELESRNAELEDILHAKAAELMLYKESFLKEQKKVASLEKELAGLRRKSGKRQGD